jgi:hypothetical protein
MIMSSWFAGLSPLTRRCFLKRSAAAAAAVAAPNIITSSALGAGGRPPASERLVMAGIGMGGRGRGVLNDFMNRPEVQVVAACDVKSDNLGSCVGQVNRRYGNQDCKGYRDYREVLARKDIDLVLCATPDHWHAQITVDACKAGKDVYCEKPLTLTVAEGRKVVNAARRYGRVATSGSQRVIEDYGRLACAARSGRFGRIVEAYADPGGPSRQCYLPGEPIPQTIDWDMWLGPAPSVPYNAKRCAGAYGLGGEGFRSWYDYSGGMMTDWGGHKFGAILHGLGLDHTGPVEIVPPDGSANPFLTYVFANGVKLHVGGGVRYVGTEGEVRPLRELKIPAGLRWYSGGAHTIVDDFLYCVKTRGTPFQDVEFGHRTATVCHLGNICYLLKRKLRWDPVKEDFVGDAEASRLVDRPRRGPWQI